MITMKNLKKTYGAKYTLGPLDLRLARGENVALIGPNGAGKSTFFQILTGHLDATEGEAYFGDRPIKPQSFEIKRQIGYLPQNLLLPPWVSGEELLWYAAALHEMKSPKVTIEQMMELWDIVPYKHRPMAACSHGMQKRVGLALAMLHNPDLLILDEPFSGLDLYHVRSLEELIEQRRKSGFTTILSTHNIPYAARICDRILMIRAGKINQFNGWQNAAWETRVQMIEGEFFKPSDNRNGEIQK